MATNSHFEKKKRKKKIMLKVSKHAILILLNQSVYFTVLSKFSC